MCKCVYCKLLVSCPLLVMNLNSLSLQFWLACVEIVFVMKKIKELRQRQSVKVEEVTKSRLITRLILRNCHLQQIYLLLNAKLFENQIPSTHFKWQTAQQTQSEATSTHTSFYSILSCAAICLMPIQFIKCVRERVRESGRESVRVRRHTHSYSWRFRYAPQHFGKQVLHTWNFCDWCALATFAIAAITACRYLTLMSLTVYPCTCVYVCVHLEPAKVLIAFCN